MNRIARKYCACVSRVLPCSGKMKRKIMGEIRMSIQEYMNEHPDAAYTDMETKFGTPQQIVSAYLDEADHLRLAGELKLKNRVMKAVLAALTVSVLLIAVTLGLIIEDDYSSENGYIETQFGDTEILED